MTRLRFPLQAGCGRRHHRDTDMALGAWEWKGWVSPRIRNSPPSPPTYLQVKGQFQTTAHRAPLPGLDQEVSIKPVSFLKLSLHCLNGAPNNRAFVLM